MIVVVLIIQVAPDSASRTLPRLVRTPSRLYPALFLADLPKVCSQNPSPPSTRFPTPRRRRRRPVFFRKSRHAGWWPHQRMQSTISVDELMSGALSPMMKLFSRAQVTLLREFVELAYYLYGVPGTCFVSNVHVDGRVALRA